MLTIRSAQWPQDTVALSSLDASFVTERIYQPLREALSFRLAEQALQQPLSKQYTFQPADSAEREKWDFTALAEENGALAGFAAAQYVAWNRRVVIWHLYVSPCFRRRGVGARLLAALDTFASSVQARCLWLETQNVNYPAIQFYQCCGFEFCGYDATLYDPHGLAPKQKEHEEQEEVALFFARPVGIC